MPGAPSFIRKSISRLTVLVILSTGFVVAGAAIPHILDRFSRLLPENYRYVANKAIQRGDYAAAADLARRRIGKHFYDFDAHYLLADAMARMGKSAEAADIMEQVLAKYPSARSKKEAVGYDEPQTLGLLARYLWAAKACPAAGEMSRAALDAGAPGFRREMNQQVTAAPTGPEGALAAAQLNLRLQEVSPFRRCTAVLDQSSSFYRVQSVILRSLWFETVERNQAAAENLLRSAVDSWPDQPAGYLALGNLLRRTGHEDAGTSLVARAQQTTAVRAIGPGLFDLSPGGNATTAALHLSRNGTARARFNTGVYRVTSLCFNASGTRALGMYPVVIVREGDAELTRVYVDNPQPHLYDLVLWPHGAPKLLDLRFEFVNDVWDPFTKADRNVSISDIILH